MDINEFNNMLRGFNLIDCEIKSQACFYLLGREDYTQHQDWDEEEGEAYEDEALQKRAYAFKPEDREGDQWGCKSLEDWCQTTCGLIPTPKEQLLTMDLLGRAYRLGGGESVQETKLKRKSGGFRGIVTKLKTVGDKLYLCGEDRLVGMRLGPEKWDWHTSKLPYNQAKDEDTAGFNDIDGFSDADLYAVGGQGDVWRYDGRVWMRVDFPTNTYLNTVCCAGNGKVYISGYEGLTFEGREDTWKPLEGSPLSLAFKDMVWYEDRVWCTSDYGLWWILDGKLVEADVPALAKTCAGNLSARDGVLLVAGIYGAAYLQNGAWHKIFLTGEMEEACEKAGLKHPFAD